MPDPECIQAQYDQLDLIASRFGQWAENNSEMSYKVRQCVENLLNGGWEGKGVEVFHQEMYNDILPATSRFTDLLQQNGQVLRQIMEIFQEAEREAASVFGNDQASDIKRSTGNISSFGVAFRQYGSGGSSATSPAPKSSPPPLITPQKKAEAMVAEMRKFYEKKFKQYGPKGMFKDVKVTVVPDKEWKDKLIKQVDQTVKDYEDKRLRLAPDLKSRAEEIKITETWEAKYRSGRISGFYDPVTKRLYIRESDLSLGVIAHELAHAYGAGQWADASFILGQRGMKNIHELEEGMAGRIAAEVTTEYAMSAGTTIPMSGDSDNIKLANEFIDKVGEKAAYEAFFGGHIGWTNDKRPEDSIVVGTKKAKFKWPWR